MGVAVDWPQLIREEPVASFCQGRLNEILVRQAAIQQPIMIEVGLGANIGRSFPDIRYFRRTADTRLHALPSMEPYRVGVAGPTPDTAVISELADSSEAASRS